MSLSTSSRLLLRRPYAIALPIRTLAPSSRRLASQDYGSGKGDPKGEKPQEQGPNPSEDKEHPGPPPPKVGQGTGGGPTQKGEKGHEGQKKSFSTYARPLVVQQGQRRGFTSSAIVAATGVKKPQGDTENAQPKILSESPPSGEDQPEEVKRHNEDMAKRVEHPDAQVSNEDAEKDKVKKGFWAGKSNPATCLLATLQERPS